MTHDTPTHPAPGRRWYARLRAAAVVGASVGALGLTVGWLTAGPQFHLGDRQAMTRTVILYHELWLDELQERGDPLRETLAELIRVEEEGALDDHSPYLFDRRFYEASLYTPTERWDVDQWGQPFRYVVDGDRYEIMSLGRDGEPGGWGFNRDISSDDPRYASRLPLPWDFLFLQPSLGVISTAFLAGVLSAAVTLLLGVTGRRDSDRGGWCLGWVVLGSILMTALLAELHVPYVSGH